MAGKKGAATGPRIPVSWGTVTRTIKGKKKKIPAISLIQESVFSRTGLKEYKFGDSLKLTKDKKGRQRIAAQGITRTGARYVLVWFGDLSVKTKNKIWHRVPIPSGISLAKVAKQLQGGKKVVELKFPSTPTGRNPRLKNANVGRGARKR